MYMMKCFLYKSDKLNLYKSDKQNQKYYIITNENKIKYFGSAGYCDVTIHRDETRNNDV